MAQRNNYVDVMGNSDTSNNVSQKKNYQMLAQKFGQNGSQKLPKLPQIAQSGRSDFQEDIWSVECHKK